MAIRRGSVDVGVVSTDWSGRRVLVTGHTGFKGAWLSLWLHHLGASVVGFADGVPTEPSLFRLAGIEGIVDHRLGDVGDALAVHDLVHDAAPDVVLHLAAQSLVRRSYREPLATWTTNVLGTANVLEACRRQPSVRAVVVATSDKCYEGTGTARPHRETDPLGGADPYSGSKAGAELVVSSWRRSFFGDDDSAAVASVRAGNVIGAGDWSEDRLVPDAVRAAAGGATLRVRNPGSVRPWQDVLDCLQGYLAVADALLGGDRTAARAWNIGPDPDDVWPVGRIVATLAEHWPGGLSWAADADAGGPHEAGALLLDAGDARRLLGWRPVRPVEEALARLVRWHHAHCSGADMVVATRRHLEEYLGSMEDR